MYNDFWGHQKHIHGSIVLYYLLGVLPISTEWARITKKKKGLND